MAINRYDVPAQDNYFNTFVQLPYAELMNTVQARQAQVDQAQAQMDQAYEQSQSLKYIPNSEDEKKIRETQAFMSDWSNKYYMQDMSDPIIRRQAMHEYRSKLNRPLIQDIQESHSAWAKNQETKRKYQAEGKYNELLDEDPATGYSTERNSIYRHMTPAQLDVRPAAEQYFNNLKDSLLYDANGNPLKDADGYNIIGVNRGDISRVVNERWRDFADTAEGRQSILLYARRNGIDPKALKPEQIKEIARQTLMDVGEEYIRTDITGSRTPEWAAKGSGSDNEESWRPTTNEIPLRSDGEADPLGLGYINFKGDDVYMAAGPTHDPMVTYGWETPQKDIDKINKAVGEQKLKLEQVRNTFPQLAGLPDRETYNAYKDLAKDVSAFGDLPRLNPTPEALTSIASTLASSMVGRNIMVRDAHGESRLSKIDEDDRDSAIRDLGWKWEDLKTEFYKVSTGKESSVSIAGIAQNGPEAGMVMVEIPDKSRKGGGKGKPRTVYISSNNEFKEITTPLNEVYNNVKNFKEGVVPLPIESSNGLQVVIKTVPKAVKNDKGVWEYDYELQEGWVTPDGSFVPNYNNDGSIKKASMDQLKEYQWNQLINSKLVDSRKDYSPKAKQGLGF